MKLVVVFGGWIDFYHDTRIVVQYVYAGDEDLMYYHLNISSFTVKCPTSS